MIMSFHKSSDIYVIMNQFLPLLKGGNSNGSVTQLATIPYRKLSFKEQWRVVEDEEDKRKAGWIVIARKRKI